MKQIKRNKNIKALKYILVLIIIVIFSAQHIIENNLNKTSTPVNNNSNKVILEKCIDGDTANFSKIGKTRFLLIDTPESTNKIEPYGKQASKFTCDLLTNAKNITYEYDGAKKDKYDRTLAYIFVDGKLIQNEIAKAGYVKKLYLYQYYYKYEVEVKAAINDKYDIWEG